MRTRKIGWRNAAYEYIKMNGPTTAGELLEMVRQKNGRRFVNRGPSHANGASQLLRVDKRFESRMVKHRTQAIGDGITYMSYDVCEWSVIKDEE